eukprot:TRINITY_DN5412_c0_g1_i1.p1 TRINITY_DN5412_c0_g1~~TRINITY_DN5412_c0_g1_i1.p1  ORF type:complete len:535 (-),score=53.02 TRINITY_DN5412_c0_g1_i1:72-1676(-)
MASSRVRLSDVCFPDMNAAPQWKSIRPSSPSVSNTSPPPLSSWHEGMDGRGNKSLTVTDLMRRTWSESYSSGTFTVRVVEARIVDEKLPDAYCVIQLGVLREKTSVERSLTPSWNYDFSVEVKGVSESKEDILIEIKNHNRVGKNHLIAVCHLPLSSLCEDERVHDDWYPIVKVGKGDKIKDKGSIHIVTNFLSTVRKNKLFAIANKHFDFLFSLMFDRNFIVVMTLCHLCKEADLSISLVRLFNFKKLALNLIAFLIHKEMMDFKAKERPDFNTLFRGNCAATRMAREYFYLTSKWGYLKKYIRPLVEDITLHISYGNSFEVDEARLKKGENLAANIARLQTTVRHFLEQILNSMDALPVNTRKFFAKLRKDLWELCGVQSLIPISNIFFLRYLCPAVMLPNTLGLAPKTLDPDVARALTLLAKIIQNTVGNCQFHEPAMAPFNCIVDAYSGRFQEFLLNLCTPKEGGQADDQRAPYTQEDLEKLVSVVVLKVHQHLDPLCEILCKDPAFSSFKNLHESPLFHLGNLFADVNT